MMHNRGISYEGDILDLAMLHKIVVRSGAWFRYGDTQLGQGKEKARTFLLEHPDTTQQLRKKIFVAGGNMDLPDDGDPSDGDPSDGDPSDGDPSDGDSV